MTTYTFSGYRIFTPDVGTPAMAATTFELSTSDSFLLRYSLEAGPYPSGYAPITPATSKGDAFEAKVGGIRVDFGTQARVAEYVWDDGKKSQIIMFEVPGQTDMINIFQMGGKEIPALTNYADYADFMSHVTAINPTFSGTAGPNRYIDIGRWLSQTGEHENDVLVGNSSFDDWANTWIKTGVGDDSVTALASNDKIDLQNGNDLAYGLGGNDLIKGGNGNDSIYGGDGDDNLLGGNGNDMLFGGNGDDRMAGGGYSDQLSGGAGADRLIGNSGADTLFGEADDDRIYGGSGNDSVDGGNGHDTIFGHKGDDVLRGGNGMDKIKGGAGDDTIIGGDNHDRMSGQGGADTFVYSLDWDTDRITDFQNNVDTLVIAGFSGVNNVQDALDHAVQDGRNVIFTFEDDDILTLNGVKLEQLTDDIVVQTTPFL